MPIPHFCVTLALLAPLATITAADGRATPPVRGVPAAQKTTESATSLTATVTTGRDLAFTKYQLDNGLEVILHEDNSLPLVAVNVWYRVGPVNEPKGRSGFAHLFEHLMFEGSQYVGANFDRYLESVGATNANGTTSWDRTNYFETVPREYLELALWLESDRMGYLRDTLTQERLDVQRDVVKNERRQSYENAPYGKSTLLLLNTLFPQGHPYHGAIIGTPHDLEAATLDDVRQFADRYYAPSNATLVLAGDIDTERARSLIEKYFGPLRRVPRPTSSPPAVRVEPVATRLVVDEPVTVAKVVFAWVTPKAYTTSHAQLHVLSTILGSGKASRLYRTLVTEQRVAVDIDVEVDANALGTIFAVNALANEGTTIETLEACLTKELARFVEQPPTPDELKRAHRRLLLDDTSDLELLNGPGGESGRAGILQRVNHYTGSPTNLAAWQNTVREVTANDLVEVAQRYLTPTTQLTVITRPAQSKAVPQ